MAWVFVPFLVALLMIATGWPPEFGVDLPEDVAYTVVKALFEQFEQFQQMHPAFSVLVAEQMINTPLAAPMHP